MPNYKKRSAAKNAGPKKRAERFETVLIIIRPDTVDKLGLPPDKNIPTLSFSRPCATVVRNQKHMAHTKKRKMVTDTKTGAIIITQTAESTVSGVFHPLQKIKKKNTAPAPTQKKK